MMIYQQYKDDVVEQWSTLKTVTMNSRTNREENVVAALGSSLILITSLFSAEKKSVSFVNYEDMAGYIIYNIAIRSALYLST